jgi:hypothetical protein
VSPPGLFPSAPSETPHFGQPRPNDAAAASRSTLYSLLHTTAGLTALIVVALVIGIGVAFAAIRSRPGRLADEE